MELDKILYIGFGLSVLVLCVFSFVVKDVTFIMQNPIGFFTELMFVSIIPALLMVFVFARTRQLSPNQVTIWFFSVMFKLMIFHILFQMSGLYSNLFKA